MDENNVIHSRLCSVDVSLSINDIAHILALSSEGFDIFFEHSNSFQNYPEGESHETASMLIHNDGNPYLTLNDKVSLLTIPCQILTKIIMLNILSKSEEYGKAKGCITLLIYCIMRGPPVNLPKLIFDNLIVGNFEHRNLPYGMVLTIFFDFWGVNLSEESFIAPSRPFDSRFINHMLSRLSKPTQDASPDEEEDISELNPSILLFHMSLLQIPIPPSCLCNPAYFISQPTS